MHAGTITHMDNRLNSTENRRSEQGRIGAWDFAAVFGSDDDGDGARVAPRAGHQTVVWVIDGEVRHAGPHGLEERVGAGAASVATSPASGSALRTTAGSGAVGVCLDAAVPQGASGRLEVYAPAVFTLRSVTTAVSGEARVFVGELFGQSSPVETHTPLVAGELRLEPGAEVALVLNEAFEYGLLAVTDGIEVQRVAVPRGEVGYTGTGNKTWGIKNTSSTPARAVLFGGEPLAN
ncbi:pirin-like C-terminal cupin domain-containing protein [Corynebacterium glaucum]|uniref:pirin-like C-terminal cupin domain-containing protein n=1 Tax=Corynebacterium glaucum TaxID=187491 RepID=UPI0025B30A5F|nr:pirin-like C-terminal cupin domain-containing protein [Corynebacterium glaucum]